MTKLRIETNTDLVNALALLTKADARTVRRWVADPDSVMPVTAYALAKAVEELKAENVLEAARGR